MAARDTTNEGWVLRQLHRVPPTVWLIIFACFQIDWKAIRDHGLAFGLNVSLVSFVSNLFSEIAVLIFVLACYAALMWFDERAKTLDIRRVGIRAGLFFGRLSHDRIANERR